MRHSLSFLTLSLFIALTSLSGTAAWAQGDDNETENLVRQFRRLLDTHQYDEAEGFAKDALQRVEARRGESHPDVARILDNLVEVYRSQGKFDLAQQASERALQFRTKLLGDEHLDVALNLNDVASLQIIQGEYQQAEPLLQRTLAIMEKIFGSHHPLVAMALSNLAVVHHRQEYYLQAELLIQRALEIRERAFPTDHPDLATSFHNLAALHDVQGRHADAQMLYQRALAMLEKLYDENYSPLAIVLNNLSRLKLILGSYSEAESFIQRSLSILQEKYGEDDFMIACGLNRLGELRFLQGDYAQAESAFNRSLAILDKTFGTNRGHPDRVGVMRHLIRLYGATGREHEAAELAGRAGNHRDFAQPMDDKLLSPTLVLSEDTWQPLEAVTQARPAYPKILRRYGTKGTIMVSVRITEEGLVQDPIVIESAHPAFERAAIEAVLKFHFKPPRRISGRKASVRLTQPFNFVLQEQSDISPAFAFPRESGGGDPAFELPRNTEKLPPEFQYDVPPVIKVVAPVVYPGELLRRNIRGTANVSVVIDPKGEVREVNILDATHPEFGLATRAMMQSWTFYPARKKDQPTWATFMFSQRFDRDGRDTSIDSVTEELLHKKEDDPEVHPLSGLDALPEPVYAPPPAYPPHLKANEVTGTVIVEFFIDKNGWVYLPRLIEVKNEELGWLALTAVSRWRFSSPLKKGKPVVARARIPVRFQLK